MYNRTTSAVHKECCQLIFRKSLAAGDIYLGSYEGWCAPALRSRQRCASRAVPPCRYNVREETFVTETEAAATEFKDPVSGKPLEKMLESSYFFKQSKCVGAAACCAARLR